MLVAIYRYTTVVFTIYLHKYGPETSDIFTRVLKVDEENPVKRM